MFTSVIFVDLEEVEVDVGDDAGGRGELEEVDSLGIAKREDEEQRGDENRESTRKVEMVAKQRIVGVREEEPIPLIAF